MSRFTATESLPEGALARLGEASILHAGSLPHPPIVVTGGGLSVSCSPGSLRLRVWSHPGSVLLQTISVPNPTRWDGVVSMALAPASSRVACVLRSGAAVLIELEAGEVVQRLARSRKTGERCLATAFSGDRRLVLHASTGPSRGTVRWSRATDGRLVETLSLPGGFLQSELEPGRRIVLTYPAPVGRRAFRLPDGEELAVASSLPSPSPRAAPRGVSHHAMWGLAFTPSGALRGAAHPCHGSTRTSLLGPEEFPNFGAPTPPPPESIGKLFASYHQPPERIGCLRLEFLPGAETLRMWTRDCSPRSWRTDGEQVGSGIHRSLRFLVLPVLSPDERYLTAVGARSDEIIRNQRSWRRHRLLSRGEIPLPPLDVGGSSGLRGRLQVFSPRTGEVLWERVPFGRRPLTALAFSPDSTFLACGSRAGDLSLFGLPDGEVRLDLSGTTGSVQALAFSPDHRFLVAACRLGRRTRKGNRLLVFDLRTRGCLGDLGTTTPRMDVRRLVFSPRGDTLVLIERAPHPTADLHEKATLCRLECRESPGGGRVVRAASAALLPGHAGAILDAAFSSDGARLATSGEEGSVLVWDVEATLRGSPALQPQGKSARPP